MSRSFLTVLLLSTILSLQAQKKASNYMPDSDEFVAVDTEPIPLNMYLIRDKIGYPAKAVKNKLEGKVFTRILVNTEGEVEKFIISRNDHPVLGEAVSREIESMRFQPARTKDSLVNYWVNVPFKFYLKQHSNIKAQKHGYRTLVQKLFKSSRKKAEELLLSGIELLDQGEYKMAGLNFKEVIQRTPKPKSKQSQIILFQSHYYLGHAYTQLKSWSYAETHYTEAIGLSRSLKDEVEEIQELLPSLYLGRGYSLLRSNQSARALADYNYVTRNFEQALVKNRKEGLVLPKPWRKDLDWVYYQKGLLYLQLDKNQQAIDHFIQVSELETPSPLKLAALSHMGLAKSKLGDFEGAFNDIQAAIEIDVEDPQPYYLKAMILMELESQEMASELLEQAKSLFAKLDQKFEIPSMYPANEE